MIAGKNSGSISGTVIDENIKSEADRFLEKNIDYLTDMIIELCSIPSPTGSETRKAERILAELLDIGAAGAYIDAAGNVLYLHDPENHAGIAVYCAHIDTVFNGIDKIDPIIKDDILYAPSSADNSANAAGLLLIIRMILALDVKLAGGILFAFDVGEEGLGDLKGIRRIVADWRPRINQVVAVDGHCDLIVNKAVGSKRYMVTIDTEGGHSWNDFGKHNAITVAARLIDGLYALPVPADPKTTYNVGVIKGGSSINTIAGHAEFTLDLRSESQSQLQIMAAALMEMIHAVSNQTANIHVRELGDRPSGLIPGSTEPENRIIKIRKAMGLETQFQAASTDANIPLSLGIPAISFGMRAGYNAHTLREYVELNSLERGMKQLAYFILADRD